MRVSFEASALKKAFKLVDQCSPARSPKPELQAVKLTVDAPYATLTATDLESWASAELPAEDGQGSGVVLLPLGTDGITRKILGSIDDEATVSLSADSRTVSITDGESSWELQTANPDLFPTRPARLGPESPIVIPASELATAIRRVAWAAERQDYAGRYGLHGCLLEKKISGELCVTGLEGHVISHYSMGVGPIDGTLAGETVIPSTFLKLLARSLPGDDTPVSLVSHGTLLSFRWEGVEMATRLIERPYFGYRRVIDAALAQRSERATVELGALAATIRKASVVTGEESRGIRFHFAPGELSVSASRSSIGRTLAKCSAGCESVFGMTFQAKYFDGFLAAFDADTIFEVAFPADGDGWGVFSTENYLFLISPLKESA